MVEIENLRVGMQVKVKGDISLSIQRFGRSIHKIKMPGTIQKIKRILKSERRVYMDAGPKGRASFHPDDLDYLLETDCERYIEIKPVTFDPNQLDI